MDIKTQAEEIIEYWFKNEYRLADGSPGKLYMAGATVLRHVQGRIIAGAVNPKEGFIGNITHAPNIESALVTLVNPRMTLRDIGGRFKDGECFAITVDYKDIGGIISVEVGYRNNTPVKLPPSRIYD